MKHASAVKAPDSPAPTRPNNGWAPHAPTPRQLVAFFSQMPNNLNPHGINTKARLQLYLRNRPFASAGTPIATPSVVEADHPVAAYDPDQMRETFEMDVAQDFPEHAAEVFEIMAPFCVPPDTFEYDIRPLIVQPTPNAPFTRAQEMQEIVLNAGFHLLKAVVSVNIHEVSQRRPFLPIREAEFADLCRSFYAEERKMQYQLNGELDSWARHVCRNVSRMVSQALLRSPVYRFGLINAECIDRIADSIWSFAIAAVTLAAAGDKSRAQKVKKLLDFQLKGNPIVYYNRDVKQVTVLCSPPFVS